MKPQIVTVLVKASQEGAEEEQTSFPAMGITLGRSHEYCDSIVFFENGEFRQLGLDM